MLLPCNDYKKAHIHPTIPGDFQKNKRRSQAHNLVKKSDFQKGCFEVGVCLVFYKMIMSHVVKHFTSEMFTS